MWEANHGASSALFPVKIFTTPAGTSLVAITSARLIAGSGALSLARAMTVFPLAIIGAIPATNPRRADFFGAMKPTTPSASGIVKL